MAKFKSHALPFIKIKYWKASGNGNPPFLIPALQKIAILGQKTGLWQWYTGISVSHSELLLGNSCGGNNWTLCRLLCDCPTQHRTTTTAVPDGLADLSARNLVFHKGRTTRLPTTHQLVNRLFLVFCTECNHHLNKWILCKPSTAHLGYATLGLVMLMSPTLLTNSIAAIFSN